MVAYVSHGGVSAAAAQTVSPAFPASISAGDGLVLVRAAKPDTAVLTTPDGWTLLDERAGGAGVFGNDTGPLRMVAYWREATGAETGNLVCSSISGTVDVQQAVITRHTKTVGTTWDIAASGGVDAVAGNDWTVTAASAIGVQPGDLVQVALSWPTDSARTWSAETLTAAGATINSTAVPAAAGGTGLGADMASRVHVFGCDVGTSSAAPTYAAAVNSATNVTGPTTMVRLREVAEEPDDELQATGARITTASPAGRPTSTSPAGRIVTSSGRGRL